MELTGGGFDFGSLFSGAQDQLTSAVQSAVVPAIGVGLIVLGIALGWKLFKRFTGR